LTSVPKSIQYARLRGLRCPETEVETHAMLHEHALSGTTDQIRGAVIPLPTGTASRARPGSRRTPRAWDDPGDEDADLDDDDDVDFDDDDEDEEEDEDLEDEDLFDEDEDYDEEDEDFEDEFDEEEEEEEEEDEPTGL
jgi:hypothetical protein